MRAIILTLALLSLLISGCATSPAPPTATPKPTWTLKPHGVLKACVYKDGEVVEGTIRITTSEETTVADRISVECVEEILAPGSYLILGSTNEGDECSPENTETVGCTTEGPWIPFEIAVDQTLEMDLDVFPPN
jgi:hypothetical protein